MAEQTGPVVQVFRAPFPSPAWWTALLTPAESEFIGRLRRQEDRERATAARALLRMVVADRVGCAAREVRLAARCVACGGEHGKPLPVAADGTVVAQASVSYSGGLVLVALADAPVGLDVEAVSATAFAGFDAIALSAAERRDLMRISPTGRAGVRTALWTAKEAILKMNGQGLTVSPTTLHVGRRGSPGVVTVDRSIASTGRAAVAEVPVPAGYRARVACEGGSVPRVVMSEVSRCAEGRATVARTARV